MANTTLIAWILETYDLPKKLQEKLTRIAVRRIDELVLTSFDSQYEYIARLVEKFDKLGRSCHLSLDNPIFTGSAKTHLERIGVEYDFLRFLPEQEKISGLSLGTITQILEDKIEQNNLAVLNQLLLHCGDNAVVLLPLSPNEIAARASQIGERLEKLSRKYVKNGCLLLPRRTIINVQFDPTFQIKYKMRRFNGNPLSFYLENLHIYGGMSRHELQQFDMGLYEALLDTKQLATAIPEKLTGLPISKEEQNKISAAHKKYGGNAFLASQRTGYAVQTIIKYWRQKQLEVSRPGRGLTHGEINNVINSYVTYKGNATVASKQLGYRPGTILSYWELAGLTTKQKRALLPSQIEEIVTAHHIYKGNASEAGRHLGHHPQTILNYWTDKGLETTSKNILPQEEIGNIINSYDIYKGNASEAGRKLKHKISTITKYWKLAGLKVKRGKK